MKRRVEVASYTVAVPVREMFPHGYRVQEEEEDGFLLLRFVPKGKEVRTEEKVEVW